MARAHRLIDDDSSRPAVAMPSGRSRGHSHRHARSNSPASHWMWVAAALLAIAMALLILALWMPWASDGVPPMIPTSTDTGILPPASASMPG